MLKAMGKRSLHHLIPAAIAAAVLSAAAAAPGPVKKAQKKAVMNEKGLKEDGKNEKKAAQEPVIKVVYDNRSWKKGMEAAWGFSCVVRTAKKTILFDTGGKAQVFWANMDRMGIQAADIDLVVLSHAHMDHVGSLPSFIKKNPKAVVYGLKAFGADFRQEVEAMGAPWVGVEEPLEITDHVHSTGPLGTSIREQSLIVETGRGSIVITGCAHPGITAIVEKAREIAGKDVLFVMGGFHLGGESPAAIKKITARFKDMGVEYAGPCHCTGEKAIKIFREDYGDHFVGIGAGRIIRYEDLD
jgi:7,8-dihydropterin-6-yl-methyl-4-(beta-D-ribofuranosyl)aminobenzene 5'-phosphate synthase